MPTRQIVGMRRLLLPLAALLALSVCLPAAANAGGLPKKQKFEVAYHAEYGQNWYAVGDDNSNWDFAEQCIVGIGGQGTSEFYAHTKTKKTVVSMPADAKKGVIYGQVPIEAWLTRRVFLGQRPPEGCGYSDYDTLRDRLDCEDGSPQWGLHGNPPAYLNIIAGKGHVTTDVRREKERELIDHVLPFCPFLGTEEGKVGGVSKLPAKKLFDGKPHTVKGKARHDQLGPETHQAEGYSEYSLTIRYIKPKKR
jgi:hypothetical protein